MAWSGAAVVVLTLMGIALSPLAGFLAESVEQIAERRGALLFSAYLGALAWSGAFLVFLAALHHALRGRQDAATALLADIGLAGGLVNSAVIVTSVCLAALAVFRTHEFADPPLLHLLHEASLVANNFTGFPTAVCVGGFAPALRRVGFPRWLLVLGVFVVLHHMVSAAALARTGFLSPGGPVSLTAPLGMTLWVGAVALLAWQRRERM